ncbi:histidine kinase [Adhaeribacter sp. BT258]|uniref:Histidine kinase n=1 Tax=Adhaeribacter terrigena TaxID=2793070 RepID=A0ABS1BYW7_9BACT|nr:two-component regulator propeller domain-containing protein [Adhaeribacter terrigena]MBK0402357.1 histidine kinase [Adhaeribacter terrigena]
MPVFRLFLLFFLLRSLAVSGQELHFNTRTFEHNNEPLKVKKLYQDAAGFVWLGTAQGLFQYDGFETKPVFPENSGQAIPPVSALFQDKHKRLWVGCENGEIYRLHQQKLTPFKPQKHAPKSAVLAMQEDANGFIWLATYGDGLYCWKQKLLSRFNTQTGLPDDYVYALTADQKGNIWAGTDRGIAICNFSTAKKQVSKIGTAQGLPDNIVTALAICPGKKTIWAGTYSGGFCQIDAETRNVTKLKIAENWPYSVISAILPTTASAALIATHNHGLFEFDGAEPEKMVWVEGEKPAGFKISDLLYDAEGSVWVAGNTSGIRLAKPALRFLKFPEKQTAAGVLAVLPDKKGNIWFSTDEGLFCARKQNHGFNIEPAFSGLPFQEFKVISLYEDAQQFLWVGTFGGGVFRIDPETGKATQFTEKNGLVNDNVLSIAGSGNEIWLATLGGASRCKLKNNPEASLQFQNYNQHDGIGFNYIYQVFIDSKKRVWFATDGKGLTKLEHGRFTNYAEKEGLTSRTVYSLAETRDGNLWVSTPKSGLFRFDNQRFVNFSTPEGLRDLNINALQTDNFGNLLVLHQKGLDILDPETGKMRSLGSESGLQQMGQDLNTMAKAADGTVWFGAQKVLVAYKPVKAQVADQPKTNITSVQLFLKPVSAISNTAFAHDENHISFEYAGLWFQQPEEVSYRLKLEGYDREWTVSNNRSITYPKLPPGSYTFKVSASATGNFENAPVQTYPFQVQRPFWNTAWFYLLSFAAGGGLLFGFIKSREKRLKKAERLEKDKVTFQFETLKNQVNPHFLFNSFNTLIGIIEDDREAAVEYVEKLSDFFRNILVYREKDTITLAEELELVQHYYFLQQKRYGSNLALEIIVSANERELLIAPLTLQLLVENAIKHNVVSRSKPLTVQLFTEAGDYLVVRNTLQKKKMPEQSTGIGLANICKRYAILTRKPVQIIENAMVFEVKIPLISAV